MRFSVPQSFGEERSELDVPLVQGFVADLDATLLEDLLNITLAQREMMIKPKSVLDDAQGKPMAIGLAISHGPSAYRA